MISIVVAVSMRCFSSTVAHGLIILHFGLVLAVGHVAGFVGPAFAAQKIALVVGIDTYDRLGPDKQLQRAVNDARSVSKAFDALGFQVVLAENISRSAFTEVWQSFLDRIQPGDIAAVYFSGHGVEIEGLNYLLPRDVPNVTYGRQEQLKRESLSVSEFLLDLRKRQPKVTVVILDACRDHPLIPPEFRAATTPVGLARMDAPEGIFIMYAAGAGETALDRLPNDDSNSINSVYTRQLLPLLRKSGLALPELARQLRWEVSAIASSISHTQRPAYYDGLIGKFCLAGCEAELVESESAHVRAASAAWEKVSGETNIAELETFIIRYKGTYYADLARLRIIKLKQLASLEAAPIGPEVARAIAITPTKPKFVSGHDNLSFQITVRRTVWLHCLIEDADGGNSGRGMLLYPASSPNGTDRGHLAPRHFGPGNYLFPSHEFGLDPKLLSAAEPGCTRLRCYGTQKRIDADSERVWLELTVFEAGPALLSSEKIQEVTRGLRGMFEEGSGVATIAKAVSGATVTCAAK
jgi:hypothetical protein